MLIRLPCVLPGTSPIWSAGNWPIALRVEIKRLAARPSLARDLKLRSQLVDASDSTCRNIAEGFGCETHREFARLLHIARRSLNEVQDCFRSTLISKYVAERI